MSQYHSNVYYDTRGLTLAQKEDMIRTAHADSYEWWVDVLDMNDGPCRKKIDMDLDGIISKLDQQCHFVFIHRKGYDDRSDSVWGRWYLEVGFGTITGVSYYLWVHVDEKLLEKYVTKYNLVNK